MIYRVKFCDHKIILLLICLHTDAMIQLQSNISSKFTQLSAKGDVRSMKAQLKKDPSLVNARSGQGKNRSALHAAVAEGHESAAKLLLRMGADPAAADVWGATVFQEARDISDPEVSERMELMLTKAMREPKFAEIRQRLRFAVARPAIVVDLAVPSLDEAADDVRLDAVKLIEWKRELLQEQEAHLVWLSSQMAALAVRGDGETLEAEARVTRREVTRHRTDLRRLETEALEQDYVTLIEVADNAERYLSQLMAKRMISGAITNPEFIRALCDAELEVERVRLCQATAMHSSLLDLRKKVEGLSPTDTEKLKPILENQAREHLTFCTSVLRAAEQTQFRRELEQFGITSDPAFSAQVSHTRKVIDLMRAILDGGDAGNRQLDVITAELHATVAVTTNSNATTMATANISNSEPAISRKNFKRRSRGNFAVGRAESDNKLSLERPLSDHGAGLPPDSAESMPPKACVQPSRHGVIRDVDQQMSKAVSDHILRVMKQPQSGSTMAMSASKLLPDISSPSAPGSVRTIDATPSTKSARGRRRSRRKKRRSAAEPKPFESPTNNDTVEERSFHQHRKGYRERSVSQKKPIDSRFISKLDS